MPTKSGQSIQDKQLVDENRRVSKSALASDFMACYISDIPPQTDERNRRFGVKELRAVGCWLCGNGFATILGDEAVNVAPKIQNWNSIPVINKEFAMNTRTRRVHLIILAALSAAIALLAGPASTRAAAVVLIDEDFQNPLFANNTTRPAFPGWSFVNLVKSKTTAATGDLPGDAANQAIQLEWTNAVGTYDIAHNWSTAEFYVLVLNASPQSWNGSADRYITPRLLQQDGTVLWAGRTLMPKYDNFGRNPWTDAQTFTFYIDPKTFTTGTEGSPLRFVIGHDGTRGIYVDNILLTAGDPPEDNDPPTPNPMTWNLEPTVYDYTSVAMVADLAADPYDVEYFFENTVTGSNSGWQEANTWYEHELDPGTVYTYVVKARDKSPNQNETLASAPKNVVTPPEIPGLIFASGFQYHQSSGTKNPSFYGWTYVNGNSVGVRQSPGDGVPGDPGINRVIQFEYTNVVATRATSYAWSAGDVFMLSLNATPQAWNGTQDRYITASLLQGDGTLLWSSGEVMLPKYDNFGGQPWTPSQTFAFEIPASEFTTGSPGQPVSVRIASSGFRGVYFDNVMLISAPSAVTDPDVSTVVASPASVPADSSTTSTITVTIKDDSGAPLADKEVTLANTAGPGMAVIVPATPVTTDASGVATFTVSSGTVGTEVFTATDITDGDSIVITQTASVAFEIVSQTSLIPGYTPPAPPAPDAPQTSLSPTTAPPPEPNAQAVPETSETPEPLATVTGPIRVTEYYLTEGDFGGTTTTVVLDQDLAADYFILVRGSRAGNGLSMPDNDYARVAAVPGGRGGLAASGAADAIGLQRAAAAFDWEGVVTVVESTVPNSPAGFRLIDAVVTTLSGTSGSQICAPWGDASRVVPFGGYRGGGAELTGGAANRYQGTSVYVRLSPSGNDTLDWQRDAGGEILADATMTTFVVEWGADWTVQHAAVAGSAGGDGVDGTGDYTTAAIEPVARANTWVWSTGIRANSGIGTCAESCVVTLGDGVNPNATESTVAVGSEYTDAYSFDVYALTHPGLAVDHRFKPDGDLKGLDIPVAVDAALPGARFAWLYNGCNGTSSRFPRPRMWSRYTADETITVSRGYDGAQFPAWIQGIDFSALSE